MATGRIRRTAQRGLAAAVLGWLGVAAFSVLMAPGATAASSATVEIRNLTPPVASVDAGGTVTFVNKIPPANRGGIAIPLVGSLSATVFTDVSVTFFGQERKLGLDQSAAWTFSAPATTGTITYTYRIEPQAGLAANVANQVVNTVAAGLPPLPAPAPYVVQTVVPALPNLPGANLPQLPTVELPLPGAPVPAPAPPGAEPPSTPPGDDTPAGGTGTTGVQVASPGDQYAYGTGAGAPRMSPSDVVAAAAFDPARYSLPGRGSGGAERGGAGGVAGTYDGAAVPVFGELAGLDDGPLQEDAVSEAAADAAPAQPLPAAALAAVVALAAVTAALIRTHQASRARR